jgi:AraC-like DNA-binding protein
MTAAIFQEHWLSPETLNGAIWRYSVTYPKPVHFHGQWELILVKRGWTLQRVGTQLHRAHARQLLWVSPGLAHGNVEASKDLEARIVHIEPSILSDVFSLHCLISGRPVIELASSDFDDIWAHCDADTHAGPLLVDKTAAVIAAFERAQLATHANCDDRRPNSLSELAGALLIRDPSLDRSALCRELDVCPSYLSRRFHAELGVTIQEFRTRIRIARFVSAVSLGKERWLQAALNAGFGSYSQMHRAFRSVVCIAPHQYLTAGGRNERSLLNA